MHFDFAFMELDIVPLRESVKSYVIRMAGKGSALATILVEVSTESLLSQLARILGGERSGEIEVLPTNEEVTVKIRLEQETFTDGERGPDGYPRNLAGVGLNYFQMNRNARTWDKVAGQVMSMEEALLLLQSLRDNQESPPPEAEPTNSGAGRLIMTDTRSSLAPIPGSDPSGPIPPFPGG